MKQHRNVRLLRALKPDAHTTGAKNGEDLDLRDVKGDVLLLVDLADKGTAGTLDLKVQDAADNGSGAADSYADVTGYTMVQMTANGQRRILINRRGLREWARVVATVGTETVDAGVVACVMEPGSNLFADFDDTLGF